MNPEIKAKWLEALRSGEYQQGKDALRSGDTYCCLGVLCELAVKDGAIPPPSFTVPDGWQYGRGNDIEHGWDASTTQLPPSVTEWAGLGSYNVYVNIPTPPEALFRHESVFLADENDAGTSFEHIARLIEEYL